MKSPFINLSRKNLSSFVAKIAMLRQILPSICDVGKLNIASLTILFWFYKLVRPGVSSFIMKSMIQTSMGFRPGIRRRPRFVRGFDAGNFFFWNLFIDQSLCLIIIFWRWTTRWMMDMVNKYFKTLKHLYAFQLPIKLSLLFPVFISFIGNFSVCIQMF